MQIILYLSVALIAVAFTILVVYMVQTLKQLKLTMKDAMKTLEDAEQQIEILTKETTSLLQKTTLLVDDIHGKSEQLNSVVVAVKDVGGTVQKFNQSVQGVSQSITSGLKKNEEKIAQIAQLGAIVFELRDKWKDRKRRKHQSETNANNHRNPVKYSHRSN